MSICQYCSRVEPHHRIDCARPFPDSRDPPVGGDALTKVLAWLAAFRDDEHGYVDDDAEHAKCVFESQAATIATLRQEQQITREAFARLTTYTAQLDLGNAEGDERAVVENIIVGIATLQRRYDALRHWLDNNTTFMDVDADWPVEGNNIPTLVQVSNRIWYHATDDQTSYPFSAVIDAALAESKR